MVVLFVHGMGRSPLSGWPLLRRLRGAGLRTVTFGYVAALQDAEAIAARLGRRIAELAASGEDYVLIGHSLGGVLLRAALNTLPPGTRPPLQLVLLGSPILPSRFAVALRRYPLFRALTGDCGQLLGSTERMQAIGSAAVPTMGIAGVRGVAVSRRRFGEEANDGVVSLAEVSAPWLTEQRQVPVVHSWLPASAQVAELILRGLPHARG